MARMAVSIVGMCVAGALLVDGQLPALAQEPKPAQAPSEAQALGTSPLIVESENINADGKTVTATLMNRGTRSISAWTLRLTATYADGTKNTLQVVRELYGTAPGVTAIIPSSPDDLPLEAGGSRPTRFPLSQRAETVVSSVSFDVVAVVVDDGSSWGNSMAVAEVFRRRQEELADIREFKKLLQARTAPGLDRTTSGVPHVAPTMEGARKALTDLTVARGQQAQRFTRTLDLTIGQLESAVTKGQVTPEKAYAALNALLTQREAVVARHANPR